MVRILIVEDQRIMQKYFESIIMREPEFRHVQTVSDACEAVKICSYSAIDLVLMDVQTFHNHDGLSAGKIIREKNPAILFHVDAIQAYGKYHIYPNRQGIDLLSVSGHKIHGPKGVGLLYVNKRVKIRPILFGGGQQNGMRTGTENVPGDAGMAVAAKCCYENLDEKIDRLYALKDHFVEGVKKLPDTRVNGRTGRDSAPQIVSVSFAGVRSEVLLHALEDKGIYVSAGSACSSNKPAVSHTLSSMHLPKELLGSTLRFSFCFDTTEEEIDYCLQELSELLPVLRRFVRR